MAFLTKQHTQGDSIFVIDLLILRTKKSAVSSRAGTSIYIYIRGRLEGKKPSHFHFTYKTDIRFTNTERMPHNKVKPPPFESPKSRIPRKAQQTRESLKKNPLVFN